MIRKKYKGWEIHKSDSLNKYYWAYKKAIKNDNYDEDDLYLTSKGIQMKKSEVFKPKYDSIREELFTFKTIDSILSAIDNLEFIKENEMVI